MWWFNEKLLKCKLYPENSHPTTIQAALYVLSIQKPPVPNNLRMTSSGILHSIYHTETLSHPNTLKHTHINRMMIESQWIPSMAFERQMSHFSMIRYDAPVYLMSKYIREHGNIYALDKWFTYNVSCPFPSILYQLPQVLSVRT